MWVHLQTAVFKECDGYKKSKWHDLTLGVKMAFPANLPEVGWRHDVALKNGGGRSLSATFNNKDNGDQLFRFSVPPSNRKFILGLFVHSISLVIWINCANPSSLCVCMWRYAALTATKTTKTMTWTMTKMTVFQVNCRWRLTLYTRNPPKPIAC